MADSYDTGLGLLTEAAAALQAAADACDDPTDTLDLGHLATRIQAYLASSRPTTTLGMPRITSAAHELAEDAVVRRSEGNNFGHVRIVPS
jgi:hypothetical protein